MIKFLIAALVVLGLLFIGLMWTVAVLAKVSLWIPASVTALIVIGLLATWVIRMLLAQRAAQGLEKALAGQAQKQAELTRPDLRPELQRIQGDFDKAVSALKTSKLGRGGNNALYQLPWYAIIGPPGAGKSTALRNSGLRFPAMNDNAAAIKGIGGTRNCDWWLTNEAVLLDTAGRWSTQEEDHGEWISFLGLLKKYRSKKPLNGLITTVSIGELANGSPAEIDALAQRMRERLDEVIAELRISLPVYVLFTKCDLIEGFVDTFGDLGRTERAEVFGFTLPLAAARGEIGATAADELERLAANLELRSLDRMPDERDVAMRQRIYSFPQQFQVMQRNVSRFLATLFEEDIYRETPTFRGAYFSSGTQEGRPFSLLINNLAEAAGIQHQVAQELVIDQKSYFLRDLFTQVIFEDRDIASASAPELRRRRIGRLALTAALALVAVAVGLVPGYAYLQNRAQLGEITRIVERWEGGEGLEESIHAATKANASPGKGRGGGPALATVLGEKAQELLPLRQLTEELRRFREDDVPLTMGFGMYQGSEIEPHLSRYYAALLRRELVQPVLAEDARKMTDFGFRYESLPHARPSVGEHDEFYNALKLHLLLTGPKAETEPPANEYRDWIAARLVDAWTDSDPEAAAVKTATENASLYSAFLNQYPDMTFVRDGAVVGRVRAALNRVPPTERALEQIIASVEEDGLGQNLATMVGRISVIEGQGTIRGAFTRSGWETRVRDMLTVDQLRQAGELWVLNASDGAKEDPAQLELALLSSAYFRAYISEWQEFLRTLRVPTPTTSRDALTMLQDLSRGQPPPVALLLQRVHYNLQLEPRPGEQAKELASGAIDKLGERLEGWLGGKKGGAEAVAQVKKKRGKARHEGVELLGPKDVAVPFEGLTEFAVPPQPAGEGAPVGTVPYDVYHEQVYYLRDALRTYMDDPEQSKEMLGKLQSARTRVRSLIDEQQVGWRPFFDRVLWPPIDGAAMSANVALASAAGNAWCRDVYDTFTDKLRSAYPFARNGHDVSLEDFAAFYQPESGVLAQFEQNALSAVVKRDGSHYSFAKKLGRDASSVYAIDLLDFLERSQDVRESFFPQGGEPKLTFQVRIHPSPQVATTTVRVGGESIEYHNGPEKWETLKWPGPSPEVGAAIEVRGANGMYERVLQEGPWGLFRIIEQGSIVRSNPRAFTVAWNLQTHGVTLKVDFRVQAGASPFFGVEGRTKAPVFLQPVRTKGTRAPAKIVLTGRPCARRR